jgi:hypothetical protein
MIQQYLPVGDADALLSVLIDFLQIPQPTNKADKPTIRWSIVLFTTPSAPRKNDDNNVIIVFQTSHVLQ